MMGFFFWSFGGLATLFLLGWIAKQIGSAYPIGCGIVILIFIVLFVKSCNDMKREEQERKAYTEQMRRDLERELKETRYMRDPEYMRQQYLKKQEEKNKQSTE